MPSSADALFPKVRQRVLAVLFGAPDRSFYTNEVIGLAQSGAGAVQRELADLAAAGLLTVRRQGNQKHFQANAASPVFAELRGLVLKTMGLADVFVRLGIAYDSEDAVKLGRRIQKFVDDEAKHESERLATLRGAFPEWEKSIWGPDATCARDASGKRSLNPRI